MAWAVWGSNPGEGGEIFHNRPDRPCDAPRLLYNGSFQMVKRASRGVNDPPPSSAEVKERDDLCLYKFRGLF